MDKIRAVLHNNIERKSKTDSINVLKILCEYTSYNIDESFTLVISCK